MQLNLLHALKKIADCYNVSMRLVADCRSEGYDFDLGFRRMLFEDFQNERFLQLIEDTVKEGVFYIWQDAYHVEYCLVRIPADPAAGRNASAASGRSTDDTDPSAKRDSIVILGPYSGNIIDAEETALVMRQNQIPPQFEQEMCEYYHTIPVISQMIHWRELCRNFFQCFYPDHSLVLDYITDLPEGGRFHEIEPTTEMSARLVEERYIVEDELWQAVQKGDLEQAMRSLNEFQKFHLARRYQDPLRDIRNSLITSNSLCARAARNGGVHPFHIDRHSARIAIRCETVNTREEADRMRSYMVRQYCLLVRNFSVIGYSSITQKVVNHINIYLAEKLSLKILAEKYNVNPCYLSTLFKKDTGMSPTAYIVQQRMRHAVTLFNMGHTQIQEIAFACGIDDASYFSKLFKKEIGMTPSEYILLVHNSK